MTSDPSVQIRQAVPADAPALAALRFEFRAPLAPPIEDEATFVERCTTWMAERLGQNGAWYAWIVEADGRLAGNLWMQVIEKLPNPGNESERHAYVTNVYVRPDYRNRGAGAALLGTAIETCAALDVDAVFLWPTARSRALYERFGFSTNRGILSLERA